MGKARERRKKWLLDKSAWDCGFEFLVDGVQTKRCQLCKEKTYRKCLDCHTWVCTNGNCTLGEWCEC